MTRDELLLMAIDANVLPDLNVRICSDEELIAFARAVEKRTLEEAEKACCRIAKSINAELNRGLSNEQLAAGASRSDGSGESAAYRCAEAFRALARQSG